MLELLLALTLTALPILAGNYGWRQHQSAWQLASSSHQLLDFTVCQQWHAAWGGGWGALYRALCRRPSAGINDESESGRGTPYRRRRAPYSQQSGGAAAGVVLSGRGRVRLCRVSKGARRGSLRVDLPDGCRGRHSGVGFCRGWRAGRRARDGG
ncbi:MAG: hypothetical protein ACR5LG_02790 [Sodalis sp. (in: enterobacteria)]|uniref:hypothetical protein n=1 Tax=Sodalis sp. (in: enterobacteria) TaxID=1898979 RepID=UPI003F313A41